MSGQTPAQVLDQVRTMAEMQDGHNRQVHPDWRTQGYAYYRAVWVECAELLDHYGWKWWKQQQPDLDQVRLEVVDIWHFGLSELIRADRSAADVAESLVAALESSAAPEPFREAVETHAAATLTARCFDLPTFAGVMRALPMSLDELFSLYVGKNVLNQFRQAHGYKTGEYRKLWQGREDNVHLIEALAELDCAPSEVPARLYDNLTGRYGAG